METRQALAGPDLAELLATERPRLMRLCARLTGDAGTAEDLAQETLLEAWRALDGLRTLDGLTPWLTAIARNVCRRWARAQGRHLAHLAQFAQRSGPGSAADDGEAPLGLDALCAGDQQDLNLALERDELALLLDHALALLPAASRAVLVASYVQETPLGELAERWSIAEGTLRVRLHRARQALRLALAIDLRAEAEALDLTLPTTPDWRESRIWCPFCGQHHLRYRVDRETGEYAFHCAGSCPGGMVAGAAHHRELVRAVSSPKALVARHCLWLDTAYRQALATGHTECECGHRLIFHHLTPADAPPGHPIQHGIYAECPICNRTNSATAWHLALDTPVAQRFWRRHPRMRALPMRAVEYAGQPAIVTGFAALGSGTRLEIIAARETYRVLRAVASDADA